VDAVLADAAAAAREGRAPGAVPPGLTRLLDERAGPVGARTAERRLPEVPAWGALVRVARHALGVRVAAGRLLVRRAGASRAAGAAASDSRP
jgi:hypothetical protein